MKETHGSVTRTQGLSYRPTWQVIAKYSPGSVNMGEQGLFLHVNTTNIFSIKLVHISYPHCVDTVGHFHVLILWMLAWGMYQNKL